MMDKIQIKLMEAVVAAGEELRDVHGWGIGFTDKVIDSEFTDVVMKHIFPLIDPVAIEMSRKVRIAKLQAKLSILVGDREGNKMIESGARYEIATAAKREGVYLAKALAWCAVTFGSSWVISLLMEEVQPLLMFFAGMTYLWGLKKFVPINAALTGAEVVRVEGTVMQQMDG